MQAALAHRDLRDRRGRGRHIGCDGQFASGYQFHDTRIVSVGRIARHKAGSAVDVAADRSVVGVGVLSVAVHVYNSIAAVIVSFTA